MQAGLHRVGGPKTLVIATLVIAQHCSHTALIESELKTHGKR